MPDHRLRSNSYSTSELRTAGELANRPFPLGLLALFSNGHFDWYLVILVGISMMGATPGHDALPIDLLSPAGS